MKGGVGKSTMCACFAGVLAARGYPIAILDLDQNRTLEQCAKRFPNLSVNIVFEGFDEGAFID